MQWSELSGKKSLTVMGISSGTSVDGVDVAVVQVTQSPQIKTKPLYFKVYKYSPQLRQRLMKIATAKSYPVDEIAYLNYALGDFFARKARETVKKLNVQVDLIGSHGQTIRHLPKSVKLGGKEIKATWQIAEGDVIAKRAGIVTVCDFRAGDIALGGEGAPLTPCVNYLLFGNQKGTAVLNIGGIANLSAWRKGAKERDILGFDCGPGNMAVDALMKYFFKRECDQGGAVAVKGKVDERILTELLKHKFFSRRPPKSTGREEFGEEFVKRALRLAKKYRVKREDLIATVSELTVRGIWEAYRKFIQPRFKIEELFISGGGVYNRYFFSRLAQLFHPVKVASCQEKGYHPKGLEGISFAVLAYLAIKNKPANLPQVTGAKRKAVLGKICLP